MPNDPKSIPFLPAEQSAPAPDPQAFRELYQSLIGSEANRRLSIISLADQLDQMSDAAVIRDALTAEEFANLRHILYAVCLDDVLEYLIPTGTQESSRFLLARYYHAIQLLGAPGDGASLEELYLYGLLCTALDYQREARDTFQKALALQPDNAAVRSALACITDCISFPRFQMDFFTRCQNAWMSIAALLKDPSKVCEDSSWASEIARKNFRLWAGLDVQLTATDPTRGSLEISIQRDWQLHVFPAEFAAAVAHAILPDKVRLTWAFYPVLYFNTTDDETKGSRMLFVFNTKVVLRDTPEHDGVHVKVYHKDLAPHAAAPEALDAVSREMAEMLSLEDFLIAIRSVEILTEPPAEADGSLYQLPDLLESLGYPLDHFLGDLEERRMRRTYTRQPAEGTPLRLRDDITKGDTILWRLQEEYERNETAAADYYMDHGIAPVFLAWPRSIMDCGEDVFLQNLVSALGKRDLNNTLKILGKASGTEYCYLDLLLWNTFAATDAIEAYFAKIPGGDAVRIQSFYWDAQPCPVSLAYLEAHASFQLDRGTVSYRASARPQNPHNAPPQKPKGKPKSKKKNAAKAKRKHSKKFH